MELGAAPRVRPHFVVYVAIALLAFSGLTYELADPDEGRYAEIPREMIERGDFVTPTLNYAPYFEKPPLLYWLTAASLMAFGEHEWAVRLVPTLFAFLGLLIVYRLALQSVGQEAARWAPAVLFTSLLYFVMARLLLTDMIFSVFLAGALLAWWQWDRSAGAARTRPLLAGLFLGLAILSKGPVAVVLFGGSLALYVLLARRPFWQSLGSFFVATAAGCLVALPWFLAVQAANPYFNHYFFVIQHFNRFSGNNFNEHQKPVWFFLPIAIMGMGLWATLWPWALARVPASWRQSTPEQRQPWLFLAAWSFFPLFFFSLSSCKLIPYILPSMWPLAALSAYGAQRLLSREKMARGIHATTGAVGVLLLAVLVWGIRKLLEQDPSLSSTPVTSSSYVILTVMWLLAAAAIVAAPRLRSPEWRWSAFSLSVVIALGGLIPVYGDLKTGMHLAGIIPETLRAEGPGAACTLAQYRGYSQSLGFYTHKRVVLIDYVGEVNLGLREPEAAIWYRKGEASIDELAQRGPLALVVRTKRDDKLAAAHHLTLYRQNADWALLLNPSASKLLNVAQPGGAPNAQ